MSDPWDVAEIAALRTALAQERAKNAGLEKELSNARTGEAEQPRPTLAAIVRTLHREVLKSRDETDALRIERDQLQSTTLAGAIVEENAALRQRVAELEAALTGADGGLAMIDGVLSKHLFPEGAARQFVTKKREAIAAAIAAAPSSTEPRTAVPAQVSAPDEQAQAQ